MERADYVLVVSEAQKIKVQDLGINPQKVTLTPNAVDVEFFNPDNPLPPDVQLGPHKTTLLFVGNLVPQKGVKYLLEAKKILDNHPEHERADRDYELIIIGDGPLKNELVGQVQEEDIKNVLFLGERRDVEQIMPSADIFVLPSISEGFPITILESLASGVPVVATRVGGVEEIGEESVVRLVEPGKPEALAQAIIQMDKHATLKEVRTRACETARKYAHIKIPY
jgi:glycosyltransferase involved in cell wall biosynthesis